MGTSAIEETEYMGTSAIEETGYTEGNKAREPKAVSLKNAIDMI